MENPDLNESDVEEDDIEPQLPWPETNATCYICNGYYGPSFEEPVCGTCHAFLFPDLTNHIEQFPFLSEKTDDEDSGNDEPVDLEYHNLFVQLGHRESKWGPPVYPRDIQEHSGLPVRHQQPITPPLAIVDPVRPPNLEQRLEMLSSSRAPDGPQVPMMQQLPPEVLLAIFGYLDDLSLCNVASVCSQWRVLLQTHIPPAMWSRYTFLRWPLFIPLIKQEDWFKTCTGLVSSCFCRTCLVQMAVHAHPIGEENSWRRHRLRNELKIMRSDPPEGIQAVPLDHACCHWQAAITGPVGSPYEGGLFYLYLQIPYSYPMSPPRVRFLTRILHPNVSRHGDVGIDSIQHNWSLALTISKVLISVQSLLTDPFTQVCMEPSLGQMYRADRSNFEYLARTWTWKYAMNDVLTFT